MWCTDFSWNFQGKGSASSGAVWVPAWRYGYGRPGPPQRPGLDGKLCYIDIHTHTYHTQTYTHEISHEHCTYMIETPKSNTTSTCSSLVNSCTIILGTSSSRENFAATQRALWACFYGPYAVCVVHYGVLRLCMCLYVCYVFFAVCRCVCVMCCIVCVLSLCNDVYVFVCVLCVFTDFMRYEYLLCMCVLFASKCV